jgi:hypothetical protein
MPDCLEVGAHVTLKVSQADLVWGLCRYVSARPTNKPDATTHDSNIWCISVAISPPDSIPISVGRTTFQTGELDRGTSTAQSVTHRQGIA